MLALTSLAGAQADIRLPVQTASAPAVHPMANYIEPANAAEVMALDPEIRQYFASRVTSRRSDGNKLQQILDAILSPDGLGFIYDEEANYDVRNTFRRRRGNCLGFALFVSAVCRDQGFRTVFQTINFPSSWDRIGEHIVSLQHINVRVQTMDSAFTVDLRPDILPTSRRDPAVQIGDRRALSIFYSNVGFFHLLCGRPDAALTASVHATQTDPTSPDAWANLGTLHGRAGNLIAARTAFARSLQLDPNGEIALVGYVDVLRRLNTPEDLRLADRLERRARALREANPYFHENLARSARQRGDWITAERELKRAVALKGDDPHFYEQWVEALRTLGRPTDAIKIEARLTKLRKRLAAGASLGG